MAIHELRILPPLAIGRLGSSDEPLAAYELQAGEDLAYRQIVPRTTFVVDQKTGRIVDDQPPVTVEFKDSAGRVRPVAPFLEVFARTADDTLEPLTLDLLKRHGLRAADVHWSVEVGNIKAFRRTKDLDDRILAATGVFSDHAVHELAGLCPHFKEGRSLPLGSVRYIRPTPRFPQVRLRFTPAKGLVYGASPDRQTDDAGRSEPDPVFADNPDRLIYEGSPSARWLGFNDPNDDPAVTNPSQIYAGYYSDAAEAQVSWGYLDDECDGVVTVSLTVAGRTLTARATICAGPPTYAPDALPIRTVADELEQILLGPDVADVAVSLDAAEEILRRGLETVRLLNTAVMNGNPVDGRVNVAGTMVEQDTFDFRRRFEPIMAPSLVDTLVVQALHARVLTALRSGTAAWFADVLRRPDEIGDLSDVGRRKMPAMMRGADGRMLTLTRRQIALIVKTAARAMFAGPAAAPAAGAASGAPAPAVVAPLNLTAQLHHRSAGNPVSTLPSTAISNCFPGLEFDFRNLWRRAFVGIVLIEAGNLVVDVEDPQYEHLVGHRLLQVDGVPIVLQVRGPVAPNDDENIPLDTRDNPGAVTAMEWSNALAHVLWRAGTTIRCDFTPEASSDEVPVPTDPAQMLSVDLVVRSIFEPGTAALAADVVKPGELTQGLCSPWQNDYRECSCYYWAASRPDYVNVEPTGVGTSHGDNWMQRTPSGEYVLDDFSDSRLLTYDELFTAWEKHLKFVIHGRVVDP